MKTYLVVVLLFSNEGWTPGWEVSGWSPREQPSLEVCMQRAYEANNRKPPRGILKWSWFCKESLKQK